MNLHNSHTIVALSTPAGEGAIGVIRLSGNQAIEIVDTIFSGKKKLSAQASHTLHFGKIMLEDQLIDEVVVSLFRNPHSYTGEDVVEISCHGSAYILQQIVDICMQSGAVPAKPGEFTLRAFLNGKMDLSQAEAVADIIASENKTQHEIAFSQMRGAYAESLQKLRDELIGFAALIELELDFSEEDIEFANREKFALLISKMKQDITQLIKSFTLGNVLKTGIPVAIIGEPNVGKSTLLNALLQEEKAIVSDIAGTTRDFIEDTLSIDGIRFRFVDTAGIRETDDQLESIGIARSYEKMKTAKIILYLCDIQHDHRQIAAEVKALPLHAEQNLLIILNKADKMPVCHAYDREEAVSTLSGKKTIEISAATGRNLDKLIATLIDIVQTEKLQHNGIFVSNTRHVQALHETLSHLSQIEQSMAQNISGELLSIDIKMALHSLGQITGTVELDRDILGTIFGKFCIGK